jgi:hypothetical protein
LREIRRGKTEKMYSGATGIVKAKGRLRLRLRLRKRKD